MSRHVGRVGRVGASSGDAGRSSFLDRSNCWSRFPLDPRNNRHRRQRQQTAGPELDVAKRRLADLELEAKTIARKLAREDDEELETLIRADWKKVTARKAEAEEQVRQLEDRRADHDTEAVTKEASAILDSIRTLGESEAARRRINGVLQKLDVWIGLDFEEAIQGKKWKTRRLKHGRICVGNYDLPVPLRSQPALTEQAPTTYSADGETTNTAASCCGTASDATPRVRRRRGRSR